MSDSYSYKIIYSDEHLVVVEKPGGLLTTPAHGETALVDLLNQQFFGRFQMFVVHRLDRGTSGLLVFARTPFVASSLANQFAKHNIEREYIAIVVGHVEDQKGAIARKVNGKSACTHYEVKRRLAHTSLLTVRLSTGRRNQIRHHFSELGHPIVGDQRIGGANAQLPHWSYQRIALHARSLRFWHPGLLKFVGFESPLPDEMELLLRVESEAKFC